MSLYPGAPRLTTVDNQNKYVLDDVALANSMAKAIDDAMADVYQKVKGKALPTDGKDDRMILFAAIARGVLQYLNDHEVTMHAGGTVTATGQSLDVKSFDLTVTMSQHNAHP